MKLNADSKKLRLRILQGEILYGLIVKAPSPAIVEMCAAAGFDFAVIDSEHGSGDLAEIEHHIRAAESFGMSAIVRVGTNEPIEILRALDSGAAGIIVPHVRSRSAAERVVEAAHYPPIGRRGLAMTTRAGRHAFGKVKEHLAEAAENTLVIVQIEDPEGIEQVVEIAAVPHVDMLFVGPTDLSLGLGYPGESDHPAVVEAIERVINVAAARPKLGLAAFARDTSDAALWQKRGAKLIALASTLLIAQKFGEVINQFR
jgi:4-hydroxy-2-oxoheptanedioate aldolase